MEEKNFFDKDEYSFDDVMSLINNNAEESINLDFKASEALDKVDGKKKEISKDVSAFANSDGGIIVYGIAEENHKANSVSFVDGDAYSKEWLEQIINSGIQRRIDGLKIYPIRKDGDIKQTIYIVKIPYSYDVPHINRDKKYYKRFNFESVPMEEYEVRQLYERKRKSKLLIATYSVDFVENGEYDDDSMCKFRLKIDIVNKGLTVEDSYKLNFYVNFENVNFENLQSSNYIAFEWAKHIDHRDYQTLSVGKKYKLSCKGRFPVFPDERVNAIDVFMLIPKNNLTELQERAKFEILLLYSNGKDEVEIKENMFIVK